MTDLPVLGSNVEVGLTDGFYGGHLQVTTYLTPVNLETKPKYLCYEILLKYPLPRLSLFHQALGYFNSTSPSDSYMRQ